MTGDVVEARYKWGKDGALELVHSIRENAAGYPEVNPEWATALVRMMVWYRKEPKLPKGAPAEGKSAPMKICELRFRKKEKKRMPVELKRMNNKWRTVLEGTRKLARNQSTGTPVDGGGWSNRDRAKGLRQVGYINEAVKK